MNQPSASEEPLFRSDTPDGMVTKQEENETLIKLAHDGNAVLIISATTPCTTNPPTPSSTANRKSFLVSSAILGQASRLFRQWFAGAGAVLEKRADGGDQLRLQATISLHAIEIILLKLHYHDSASHDPKTPQELEAVMREASKLACTRALSPWIRDWVSEIPTATNLTEQKAFVMSAYFSEDQKLIEAMVARAAWGATKKEWEAFEQKSKEKMPASLLRMLSRSPPSSQLDRKLTVTSRIHSQSHGAILEPTGVCHTGGRERVAAGRKLEDMRRRHSGRLVL